jgi:hypothetical protein
MGFVETTNDKQNLRADLEGWVAIRSSKIDKIFEFLHDPSKIIQIMKLLPIPSYAKLNLENLPQYMPLDILQFA